MSPARGNPHPLGLKGSRAMNMSIATPARWTARQPPRRPSPPPPVPSGPPPLAAQAPVRATDRVPVLVWVIAAVFVAVELAVSGRYGFLQDELYFIEAGRHLAFGYVDQPPLAPLLTRVTGQSSASPHGDPDRTGAGRRGGRGPGGPVRGAVRRGQVRPGAGRAGHRVRSDRLRARAPGHHRAAGPAGLGGGPAVRDHGGAARPAAAVGVGRRRGRPRPRRQQPDDAAADRPVRRPAAVGAPRCCAPGGRGSVPPSPR